MKSFEFAVLDSFCIKPCLCRCVENSLMLVAEQVVVWNLSAWLHTFNFSTVLFLFPLSSRSWSSLTPAWETSSRWGKATRKLWPVSTPTFSFLFFLSLSFSVWLTRRPVSFNTCMALPFQFISMNHRHICSSVLHMWRKWFCVIDKSVFVLCGVHVNHLTSVLLSVQKKKQRLKQSCSSFFTRYLLMRLGPDPFKVTTINASKNVLWGHLMCGETHFIPLCPSVCPGAALLSARSSLAYRLRFRLRYLN